MTKSNKALIEAYDQAAAKARAATIELAGEAKRLGVPEKDLDQSSFREALRAQWAAEEAILKSLKGSGLRLSLLKRAMGELLRGNSSEGQQYLRLARGISSKRAQ